MLFRTRISSSILLVHWLFTRSAHDAHYPSASHCVARYTCVNKEHLLPYAMSTNPRVSAPTKQYHYIGSYFHLGLALSKIQPTRLSNCLNVFNESLNRFDHLFSTLYLSTCASYPQTPPNNMTKNLFSLQHFMFSCAFSPVTAYSSFRLFFPHIHPHPLPVIAHPPRDTKNKPKNHHTQLIHRPRVYIHYQCLHPPHTLIHNPSPSHNHC